MIIDASAPESIEQAAQSLLKGALIGLPTETVYGLASDAMNDDATLKIFSLKGRPVDHPLIAHVVDKGALQHFASDVPLFARYLIEAFWPGPLTLILKKIPGVAQACTAGAGTIALRCPLHPVAQLLLKRCSELGVWGLAAPSANRFGRVSPTTARHVLDEFGESLLILDGGPCEVGIESTIVDCTRGAPVVLRPGILTLEQISIAAKQPAFTRADWSGKPATTQAGTPKASGTLDSHYAPNALLRLLSNEEIINALASFKDKDVKLAIWAKAHPTLEGLAQNFLFELMPNTPEECARALFAQLRAFDTLGITEIWVEKPPQSSEWAGITDRLQRAAHIAG